MTRLYALAVPLRVKYQLNIRRIYFTVNGYDPGLGFHLTRIANMNEKKIYSQRFCFIQF